MPRHTYFNHKTKLNKIIILLTLSDIFSWGIFVVLNAIVGIYLSQKLGVDSVKIVGIGTAIMTTVRGVFQLPMGELMDKWKYDIDEILTLSLGNIMMGTTYIFYPGISTAEFYYVLQFVFGLGAAFNLIAWRKLFAQNLDRHDEGLEYGAYGLVIGITSGLFGIIAGIVANLGPEYFNTVIIVIGWTMIASSIFPLIIFRIHHRRSGHG